MDNRDFDKYTILRKLALAGSAAEGLQQAVQKALEQAAGLLGLQAAAIYLWDDQATVTTTVTHSESESYRESLVSLEEDLFRSLRQDRQVLSAYISFGGDKPLHSFTLPLQHGKKIFGAAIGIQEGGKKLVAEDDFLEAVSAAIALNVIATNADQDSITARDLVDKERLGAILETAVAVNHEINNPLTAILGNVQLLLLKRSDLDEELTNKLKTIENSAMRIRDVTQKLLRLTSARSVHYADGTNMIDLSGDEDRADE